MRALIEGVVICLLWKLIMWGTKPVHFKLTDKEKENSMINCSDLFRERQEARDE
jgi:hypothetical protein